MSFLRSKASQFFKTSPTQDEKAAITPTDEGADFGAGIERSLRKKPSRFLCRHNDKPLPSTPPVEPPEVTPLQNRSLKRAKAAAKPRIKTNSAETKKLPPSHPALQEAAAETQVLTDEGARKGSPAIKKRPSFASLRKSSSRIFHSTPSTHDPPPPPLPQLPIDTPTPKPRRPTLRPRFEPLLSSRSPRPSHRRITSISRPTSTHAPLPSTYTAHTLPFTKPPGPPPPRPHRSASIDTDLVALSRDGSLRTVLRGSLTTSSSSSSTSTSSHSTSSTASSYSTPLAANFPLDPARPLPFRDAAGGVKGYGRFSAYVMAGRGYGDGGYDVDGEGGAVEMYDRERGEEWRVEGRVCGEGRGVLYRDRRGGWHLVGDI